MNHRIIIEEKDSQYLAKARIGATNAQKGYRNETFGFFIKMKRRSTDE
jgi:hypothetical protein